MTEHNDIARWDKLKSWKVLEAEIEEKLNSSVKYNDGITLEIGPQLLYTLRHPSALRSMQHTSSTLGEIFTCHYNKGAVQGVRVWILESQNRDGAFKQKGFETDFEITCMTYVTKHRVYVVSCSDLTLRVITDARSNFVEVNCISRLATTLCLVYDKEDNAIYAGGIGSIEQWRINGVEHAAALVPGRKFFTDLTQNDWIRDIKIVRENNHIIAQHSNGLCVIHFRTRRQIRRLPNRHEGPLTCCCYYPLNDLLITGGSEGKIRVFSATAFNMLHVFIGHHRALTAMESHSKDSLLFTSSHDGTVKVWRMDTLQLYMRLEIGRKIFHMSLFSDTEFYVQTEKNIMIYSCRKFYEFFASVESETKRLMCCRGKDLQNRIIASTEDGGVRLFSPITGLTLTVIYPLPSFQVLMSFAYDIHQDRLHTVLSGGRVIVYNTTTNPCKAEEVWVPTSEDEHVNILLLVTVEFPCEDGTDLDNLVFGGLTNGQIMLCDAVVCSLDCPVQAHEGVVTSLVSCLHPSADGHYGGADTASMIISGGTDMLVKVWKLNVDVDGRRPIVYLSLLVKVHLPSVPLHICIYSCNLWISFKTETKLGTRWKLLLNKLVKTDIIRTESSQLKMSLHKKHNDILMAQQMTHSEDEDHVLELTSIDKCPFLNIVMTSGRDGVVKIWNSVNELLREMNFATPIFASCFANDRGDILVGFGMHICSVSVVNYLPLDYLKQVTNVSKSCLKDDIRELPVKFDHKSEPWLDLKNLRHYSIDIYDRRRQRLEEEVIGRLKKAAEKNSTKFLVFVDGKTTKVIRNDYADQLLNWAQGKEKFKFGVKTAEVNSLLTAIKSETENNVAERFSLKKKGYAASKTTATKTSVKEEKVFFDSEGLLEIYPSAVGKALQELGNQRKLGPTEMRLLNEQELLKKDPIIAPDGYIPNSVIRRKVKETKGDISLRITERPFQLKPVPSVKRQHLPSWWDTDEKEEATPRLEYRVMKWDDTPSPPPKSEISSVSSVSLKSLIESPVKKYIAEGRSKTTTPRSPKSKSEQKNGTQSVARSRNDTTPVENVKKMIKANNKNMKTRKSELDLGDNSEQTDTEQMVSSSIPTSGMSDVQRISTTSSETPQAMKVMRHQPSAPTNYKLNEKRIELARFDYEMKAPVSPRLGQQFGTRSEARSGAQSGARSGAQSGARSGALSEALSEARENSLKLTNYAVDEDSSAIDVKETKSGCRPKSNMSHMIIEQLMAEDWMPHVDEDFDYNDVIDKLILVLDDQNDPNIYDSACTYIEKLLQELGLTEEQIDQALCKLGIGLNSSDSEIKGYALRGMQTLGQGRTDVLMMILPKLVDPEESIRTAAADAIRVLTGATDRENLLKFLEESGIISAPYCSKADEEYTFAMLAEKYGEHEEPQVFNRIQNWVEDTTPGIYEYDREDEETMWQESSRSHKEHSFMSEGKSGLPVSSCRLPSLSGYQKKTSQDILRHSPSWIQDPRQNTSNKDGSVTGKKDGPLTQRSMDTTSTFKRRMKETDGFSTISDRSSSSRKSRGGRTPTSDIGRRNSSRVDYSNLRQDTQSDSPSLASTEHGLPLPFTLPSQARDSGLSGTPSSKCQLKISMKLSPGNILQETTENLDTSSTDETVTTTIETSKKTVKIQPTVEEEKVEPVVEKALTVSSEQTTVSIDTNTGSIETQPVSKGMPANTPEIPIATNELPWSSQDASAAIENQRMEPISEDMEAASFLKTPRAPETGIPMESTALDEPSLISKETDIKKDDVEKSFRLNSDQGTVTPDAPSAIDIRFTPKDPHLYRYYREKTDTQSEKQLPRNTTSTKNGPYPYLQNPPLYEDHMNADNDMMTGHVGANQEECRTELGQITWRIQDKDQGRLRDKDSDYQSISNIANSQGRLRDKDLDFQSIPNVANTQGRLRDEDSDYQFISNVANSQGMLRVKDSDYQSISNIANSQGRLRDKDSDYQFISNVANSQGRLRDKDSDYNSISNIANSQGRLRDKDLDYQSIPNVANSQGRLRDKDSYYQSISNVANSQGRLRDKDSYYQSISNIASSQGRLRDKDSDYHSISNIASTQITDRLSGYDSGFAKDMSEFSYGRAFGRGIPHTHLSPVKSESASPPSHSRPQSPKDWRKFFDLVPNAQERKQMEQIRREMEQGKLKHATLPPISYFAEDLPMLPGEAGTRLLQTVRVGEKVQVPGDGRHRIESVPGKLAVHTQNEDAGLSNFGILQMQWTTGVPTVKDRIHPPQKIPQHRSHRMIRHDESELNSATGLNRMRQGFSEEELNLPYLDTASPAMTNRYSSNQYEWEFPLPPPPAKESRTEVPQIRRDHENYCKYYHLVKKKLHLYTSQKEKTKHLPELFVKRLRDQDKQPCPISGGAKKKKRSLTKTDIKSSVLFPPIKLRQLVNIC